MELREIMPGDRVVDPLDGSIRTVREMRFGTVLMEDGGGMGESEVHRIYRAGEEVLLHSPGPWEVVSITKKVITVRDKKQRLAFMTSGTPEQDQANASLMAAAPELLRAARNALGYMRRSKMAGNAWADDLEEAIKLAEGGA